MLLFDAEHTIAAKASQPAQATAYEPKTPCTGDSLRPLSAVYRTRGRYATGSDARATREKPGIDAGFKLRDVALIARASEKFVGGADASELASVLPADIPPLNSTSASGSGR